MLSEDHVDSGWMFLKITKSFMCKDKTCAPRINSRCQLLLREHVFGSSSNHQRIHRQLPLQSSAVITANKLGITVTAKLVNYTPFWMHGAPSLGAGATRQGGLS